MQIGKTQGYLFLSGTVHTTQHTLPKPQIKVISYIFFIFINKKKKKNNVVLFIILIIHVVTWLHRATMLDGIIMIIHGGKKKLDY